jgi:IS30 family transposase
MGVYNHLSLDKRNVIEAMLNIGSSQKNIATATGFSESSISYEISKNTHPSGTYSAEYAEAQATKRRDGSKKRRVLSNQKIVEYIDKKLKEYWSPEQISGRGKIEEDLIEVSTESIYEYIYLPENRTKELWKYLRRSRKRPKKQKPGRSKRKGCNIHNRVSIHKRPEVVNERSRIGDFEGDSVVGARQGNDGALGTFSDRTSSLVLIGKMERKCSNEMCRVSTEQLKRIPKSKRHTMTIDNGSEFVCHEAITAITGVQCFFADPYSSWQRGANENTNGLIRQFFPKGTSFKHVTQEDVDRVANLLNNRPRKRLGFKTPLEVFFKNSS